MPRYLQATLSALLAAALIAGCGESDEQGIVVSGASSLTEAFRDYADADGLQARFSFGGSDQLAAQIRQGADPDVFASADPELIEGLADDGLVGPPEVFARNELAVAVPVDSGVTELEQLTRPGLDIVACVESAPCGLYSRQLLDRLPGPVSAGIEANFRSRESDVKAVTGKLLQGAADAGFIYATDVVAASGELRPIPLPSRFQPEIEYSAAVVTGSDRPELAAAFIAGLGEGPGSRALRAAGFEPGGGDE